VSVALVCDLVDQDVAVRTLGRIGPAASTTVDALAEIAGNYAAARHVRAGAAWALWRITGEEFRASLTFAELLRADQGDLAGIVTLLGEIGPAMGQHAGSVQSLLAARQPQARVAAAVAWWRLTGDNGRALPILLEYVRALPGAVDLDVDILTAIEWLGRIGPAAAAAAAALRRVLDDDQRMLTVRVLWDPVVGDQYAQQVVATALARITRHVR
jgi:hypothetical protein